MATREPVECPVCREPTAQGQQLEDHLLESHSKPELASFVAAETTVPATGDPAD
ncbi:hypothetical protein [Natrinema sp. 1APR25-10V2]|uniref:hypothetical protein n=1 Tax=Natrinema sp. 1APR25-10V2 TaxID=2951081 RepID=UPI0028749E5C|nr:hypothetical protein [Natrinema sp. 1APR25-10V2]MDS0475843.1 hypothetical protein [Natrinema sp. 1APR25-10V2]